MSRIRIVGGKIIKNTAGKHSIFSKGNIILNAKGRIIQEGKENGVHFGEPKKYISESDFFDPIDYILNEKGFITRYWPNGKPKLPYFDTSNFASKANLYNSNKKIILKDTKNALIYPLETGRSTKYSDGKSGTILHSYAMWGNDTFIGADFTSNEILDFFKILADNASKVEWTFHTLIKGEKRHMYIGTSHKYDAITSIWIDKDMKSGYKIEEDWHTHPGNVDDRADYPSGFTRKGNIDSSIPESMNTDRKSFFLKKGKGELDCQYFYIYTPDMQTLKEQTIWYNDKEYGYGYKK